MSLLNPLALALLPLVTILFWLNNRPRERQSVGNLYLWQQAATVAPARLRLHRLRRHWLLVLQAAFMATVIAALARPTVAWRGRTVDFVFDLSASMAARSGNQSRLDLAKARALALVPTLSSKRLRIIAAGADAVDRGEFRASGAIDAIRAMATTGGAAALADAIRLAHVRDGGDTDVYVFTDFAEARASIGPRVHWIQVGAPAENVAVTTLSARRKPGRRVDGDVLIGLRNFGPSAREVSLELKQDGVTVASEQVRLEPRSARTVLENVAGLTGVLEAIVSPDDDLPLDNRRRTIAPPLDPLRVLLRTSGNLYLERALASNPTVALEVVAPAAAARRADYDVVVCDQCAALPRQSGGVVLLRANGTAESSDTPAPLVVSQSGHPVGRSLEFADVLASLTAAAPYPSGADVIVRAGGRAAVVAYEQDGRRVVDVRIDRGDASLPLSIGFPVLVANAVEWVAERNRDPVDSAGVPPGESDLSIRPFESTVPLTTRPPVAAQRQPEELAIWFIVAAVLLLALEWWVFRLQRSTPPAFLLRAIVTAVVLLAAVGLGVPVGAGSMDVMFVLDRSDSVSARGQTTALARVGRMAASMRSGDRAGLVVFGRDAALERQPATRFQPGDISSDVNASGTDIAGALRLARSALTDPTRGRIVLATDGRETIGNAADEASKQETAIDTLATDSPAAAPLRVTTVSAPADVRRGEPFTIRVDVEGATNARDRLVVYRDRERIAEEQVTIPASGFVSVTVADVRRAEGFFTYTAAMASDDDDVRAAGSVVSVSGLPAILYVGGDSLVRSLAAGAFAIEHVAADRLPADVSALRPYAAVVLDRVPADHIAPPQAAALAAFVEQTGGGLIVLCDARGVDEGGYSAGPLETLLPVDFRPRAGRRQPSMGLALVFDKSGSMADRADGMPKIEIAREAARKAFAVVPAGDSIGLVAFDATPTVAVPFGPAGDASSLAERLGAIQPGGSTAIAPAVDVALDWLRHASVSRRYILLVSDGRTSPADADRLRAAMRGSGVQLSVVAIGADADRAFLQELAESSGGRAYFPDDARLLPSIVQREASRAAGGSVVREPFTPRALAHPVVAGIDRRALPPMSGYLVSAGRPGAAAILTSHLDDPILAGWQAGLGRVVVFTSDLASPWTASFRRWPSSAALWTQAARWVGRRATDAALTADVVEDAGSARLVVVAERPDGQAVNLAEARVDVRAPNGREQSIELQPRRPGLYEAPIPATETGAYVMSVSGRDENGADARVVRGFYWSADRERRSIGVDTAMLARLSAATGGRVLGPGDNPFDGERPRAYQPLRPLLLATALLLFLVDIATRGRRLFARHAEAGTVGRGGAAA